MTDASSLRGGELLRAELKGVDGQTYVVAQGAVTVAGYTAGRQRLGAEEPESDRAGASTAAWSCARRTRRSSASRARSNCSC
jgi:flagellar basal body P-ring protein FlgI